MVVEVSYKAAIRGGLTLDLLSMMVLQIEENKPN